MNHKIYFQILMCFYWLEITVWSNLSLEHFGGLNYLHSTWSQGAAKTPLSVPTWQAWELWHNWNDTHEDVLSKNHQFSSKIDVIAIRTPVFMFHFSGFFFPEYSCIVCFSVYFMSECVWRHRRKTQDNFWVPSYLSPVVTRSHLLFLLLCISLSRLARPGPPQSFSFLFPAVG